MYSWLSKSSAVSQLQARLYNSVFWSASEAWIFLTESLRLWSALTEIWPTNFVVSGTAANGAWIDTSIASGSPRIRTVTDTYLYNQICAMLLEPQPIAGVWQGTNQFALSDIQNALQKRIQEVIQATACTFALVTVNGTPGTRRYALPDTTLQPRRIRFIPATGFGNPFTLTREDTFAMQTFNPSVFQETGTPQSWSMVSEPPLGFDVDYAPNVPGSFEVLTLTSGPSGDPTDSVLVGVPDDWSWLPMYGALADLLSREPEASDKMRSAYALKRYTEGLDMMRNSNWLLQGSINGVMADTPSLYEKDVYSPEWQQAPLYPSLVQAGIDYIAPTPGTGQSVGMTLVGNAPLLDTSGTYVQVSRDDWSAVLGMAHHIASFKLAGADFARSMGMEKDFYRAAAAVNQRLLHYGPFADILRTQGQRQEMEELR